MEMTPLNSQLPDRGIHRILVCRTTHSLGNTLLLTPLIRELQIVYPGSEIDIVTRSSIAQEIFGKLVGVRNVFQLPAHGTWHPIQFLRILRKMRANNYNLVIDPYPRSRTGRALLLCARGRYKLAFVSPGRTRGVTHGVSVPETIMHVGHQPAYLLRAALARPLSHTFPPLDIGLSSNERKHGRQELRRLKESAGQGHSCTIGIFANATGTKLLPATWWSMFASAVTTINSNICIVEIVPGFGRSLLNFQYPSFFSSDIRRLASFISGLSLFVSADCGVMHLACATGVTVAGIFSVTNPAEWGPYGPRDFVVSLDDLSPQEVAAKIVAKYREHFFEAA
jgi:heptosyltransferase III